MATIYKRGEWYYVKYVWNGKRLTKPMKTKDLEQAKLMKMRLEVALMEKKLNIEEGKPGGTILVSDLINPYRAWLPTYHQDARRAIIERVLDSLDAAWGPTPIADFGPVRLAAFRDTMVDAGLARLTVNDRTQIVVAMFRWGVENELVSWDVYNPLKALKGLCKGRTKAGEYKKRTGVLREHVMRAVEVMPPTLQKLVITQYLTGARPGELLKLTPSDIDRTEEPWVIRIVNHKGAWREGAEARYVALGPKARKILAPLIMQCKPSEPLFSPLRAQRERWGECKTHRTTPPAEPRTDRKVRDHYDTASYRKAIARACAIADIPEWTPQQLRHQAANEIERAFGAQAARAVLGHSNLNTTSIYLHEDLDTMKTIAEKRG